MLRSSLPYVHSARRVGVPALPHETCCHGSNCAHCSVGCAATAPQGGHHVKLASSGKRSLAVFAMVSALGTAFVAGGGDDDDDDSASSDPTTATEATDAENASADFAELCDLNIQ